MTSADPRLRAACDLLVPEVRDSAGRHEYDGVVPDLSPAAVGSAVARLGGTPLEDPHDEAHLSAVERRLAVELGQVQMHRRTPRKLLTALDLSVYDKPYAPPEERAEARRRHLAAWPAAIDAALPGLDLVSAPAATALLPAVRGAAAVLDPSEPDAAAALRAHERLVTHLEDCAVSGDPDAALGEQALAALLGAEDALDLDLDAVLDEAAAERDRLVAWLTEECAHLRPGVPPGDVVRDLSADHPTATGVLVEAAELTDEVVRFVRDADLLEHVDGECVVAPSPPSRRHATAMLTWAAPYEPDGPSTFAITPPDPTWPPRQQDQWLSAANRTTLPSTTAHEVAPGHFSHGRALRRARGDVRRTFHSSAFVEGWAHYAEELMVEVGFRSGDPRFPIGVCLKALMRVTRLTVSIGLHTRATSLDEAVGLFERDAFLQGPAARGEAMRAVHDPTYGRYTLGKLALLRLRDHARDSWGDGFTLRRFHDALLRLGAPPLGLLDAILEDGQAVTRA